MRVCGLFAATAHEPHIILFCCSLGFRKVYVQSTTTRRQLSSYRSPHCGGASECISHQRVDGYWRPWTPVTPKESPVRCRPHGMPLLAGRLPFSSTASDVEGRKLYQTTTWSWNSDSCRTTHGYRPSLLSSRPVVPSLPRGPSLAHPPPPPATVEPEARDTSTGPAASVYSKEIVIKK
ncbi:hypothetical protein EVAR_59566_1 [Eumeta japonica]|uniref:Uncharacterized protein n=1 Tax=Eumeta variegata TaxID=151549 RepID=A0A4C1YRA4_EUMVA|nr:hypothetical protein EVAR_59566_1 [Eumeta japonica]